MATRLESIEVGPYEITLDVFFSAEMLASSLINAANYRFSGNAYARYVETLPLNSLAVTGVRLWVEGFSGSDSFTFSVLSPPILDAYGNPLEDISLSILPFQSSAFFSNTTALVRSWHDSKIVSSDTQRLYLSGTKGTDTFYIANGISKSRKWSQILDSYGIDAACLSRSENYIFSDLDSPVLSGLNPAPGATGISQSANIYLSILDEITSVDLSSVAIYVRNTSIPYAKERIFSGIRGWEFPEVGGGYIIVERKGINIKLIPTNLLDNGLVTITILANDLIGNILSTSYDFTVGGSLVTEGFGLEFFGTDPFGT